MTPYSDDALVRSTDHLYLVLSDDGHCKIGRSITPETRLRHLQTHSPHRLTMPYVFEGMGWQEKVWHSAFNHLKLNGEWFTWGAEIGEAADTATKGEEWIAGLVHPRGLDNHVWRDRIADREEMAADRCGDSRRCVEQA